MFFSRLAAAIKEFWRREDGPTAIEYALILALIIILVIAGIDSLGEKSQKTYQTVEKALKGKTKK